MARVLQVPNDDLILQRARKGDLAAMEEIYKAYAAPVYNLARRFCKRPQDAEEVAQETFLEVFRSLGRFRGEAPFWVWVRRIAASKALMRIREAERHKEESLDGGADDGAESLSSSRQDLRTPVDNEKVAIEKALAELPPTSRAVIWLHDVEGYTHEEIAELFDRSVSFSKSQLARAHERLRAFLITEREGMACTQPLSSS
jgi:RNA polymerase sigma factor (sigma-70 family)